ncbi:sugar phosphate isomerase/epimerase family protein [Foetidibacter luteolus]|uniref:sugar phosphate isomerase/epimerase family protein n=1 Tax=Foetidibacter luteolus TaxID=2608880 RepID=UPI00129BF8E8|nr:sugar phosphate isomerase/epimerase family protein [Foetidibacter luteolus]
MINRRNLLKVLGGAAAGALLPRVSRAAITHTPVAKDGFTYCLNMATIRGHKLGFAKELETASKAGFTAVEIWIDSLETYLKTGGTLTTAKQMLNDLGITVENAIGFAEWIVDDDARRSKALEQMRREMDMLAQIGCKRTAAPPMGATGLPLLDLNKVAERYRNILLLGDNSGVVPHLELWGFSKNLGRVSEVMYAALQTGHPAARVLLDVFHLYKGGSSLETLPLISKDAIDVLHMNDYAAGLTREAITDADRIYPGDGVAPVKQILQVLKKSSTPLVLSLEVFNKNYYAQPALEVAKTALAKMKAVTTGV